MRLFDFSIFGCPNSLHPNHPWRRRAIRGSIATGIVISSPVLIVGATLAGAVILPPYGIYRLGKHLRERHRARHLQNISTPRLAADDPARFQDLHMTDDPLFDDLPRLLERLRSLQNTLILDELLVDDNSEPFANMDVENLFSDSIHETTVEDKPENNTGERMPIGII